MEDKLLSLLKSVSLIPVLDQPAPGVVPCVTFHFFGENGVLFGAGKATQESASCQVDIWYNMKTENIINTIKEIKKVLVNEKTYSHPTKDYIYEQGNKIHHTYFTFELIKESEE